MRTIYTYFSFSFFRPNQFYAMTTMAIQLDAFPRFPCLPLELRLQVWDATMEPSLLHVDWSSGIITTRLQWSPERNPVAFGVCVESRTRALEHHDVKLPIYPCQSKQSAGESTAVRYLDLERDLVFVEDSPKKSAADSRFFWMDVDFRHVKSSLYTRASHLGDSHTVRDNKVAVRRIVIPGRWWQYIWSWYDPSVFIPLLFTEFREIYLLQEMQEEQQQQSSGNKEAAGCCAGILESLLPDRVREGLQTSGWEIRVERQSVVVTNLKTPFSVRIRDFLYAPSDRIGISTKQPTMAEYSGRDGFFPIRK